MTKAEEIVKAWYLSMLPNEHQVMLAGKRLEVCHSCDQRKETVIGEVCGKCGCPLSKKVFSPRVQDACPLGKWDNLIDRPVEPKSDSVNP